jgi:catechol 2,3-dioxygenase-like lactoylglutathione lyase family enzyme
MNYHLRIARPVGDLQRTQSMYRDGLGIRVIGSFKDHDGFDGVMMGAPGLHYHFEFTRCAAHPVAASPTPEDLAVFYIADAVEWERVSASMLAAGFTAIASFNPYWDVRGRTFQDTDGYRVVLQNAAWENPALDIA